jgi:hypothetical protein
MKEEEHDRGWEKGVWIEEKGFMEGEKNFSFSQYKIIIVSGSH